MSTPELMEVLAMLLYQRIVTREEYDYLRRYVHLTSTSPHVHWFPETAYREYVACSGVLLAALVCEFH